MPSGRIPLTAPIRPPAKPRTFIAVDRPQGRLDAVGAAARSPRPVASAYHWPASWSAMMLSELGAAAVVVGVVVAAPQPAVEGDLAALEPARPAARGLGVAQPPAIASAAASAPSHSEPP